MADFLLKLVMENPFVKLVREEFPSEPESVSKEEALKKLREWRKQVEMGMNMERTREDAQQLEIIDEQIRKIEQGE